MGALRWNGRDARFCIENRFSIFAHLDRFRNHEPGHGVNPAQSVFVKLKHVQNKFCSLRQRFSRAWKGDNEQVSCRLFHVKQIAVRGGLQVQP